MAIARPEGVGRVVLIQHSVYHLFDNSYLIDAVRRHPKLFRIQGMVNDHQPHPGEAMKKLLSQGVTGFRITPFIRKPADQLKWLETPGMLEMWRTAAETRQAMCLLIIADDLPSTDQMCRRYPETPVVIDHFARIGVDGQMRESDIANLCRLARYEHTSVKISAFYALGQKRPPHDELIPMIKRLFETFGSQRLMWAIRRIRFRVSTITRRQSASCWTGSIFSRRTTATGCSARLRKECFSTHNGPVKE